MQGRGVVCDGHYVMLSDLRDGWPSLYNSMLLVMADPCPGCPACGSPLQHSCTACDFVAA